MNLTMIFLYGLGTLGSMAVFTLVMRLLQPPVEAKAANSIATTEPEMKDRRTGRGPGGAEAKGEGVEGEEVLSIFSGQRWAAGPDRKLKLAPTALEAPTLSPAVASRPKVTNGPR